MRILDLPECGLLRRFNIPCEVQGLIMFSLNLHIICREGDAGNILGGMEAVFYILLLCSGWNLGHEELSIS